MHIKDQSLDAIAALPRKPTRSLHGIPGDLGLPLIGHSQALLADAPTFVRERFERYGPVFKISAFGTPSVNFADIESARMILMNKDRNFSNELGWSKMSGLLRRGILLRDFSDHRGHRRVLQQAFKRPVLEHYAAQLNKQLEAGIKQWPIRQVFKFQPQVKSLLLNNAASLLLGAKLGHESEQLNHHFISLLHATVSISRFNIPGTSWHKGMQGGVFLRSWLNDQVSERRTSDNSDFFTTLCKLSQDPENEMSINDVLDHTVLLLFAAHDTTTSTACSMLSVLCEEPSWQDKLRSELHSVNTDQLTLDDFAELPLTDQFFKEVLRRYPPIFVILRRCINAFEYQGIKIPANTQTNVNVSLLHHNEAYWSDPQRFDPDRFSTERAEHKQDMFQYLPFGGGAHKCLGVNFAEIQTKILLFHLLKNYQINTHAGRQAKFNFMPMPLPKDGLPVTLTPL